MTNEAIEAERKAFESHPQFKYMEFDRDKDAWGRGKYKHSHIQALWEGWQARAAASKQGEAELVANEASFAMIEAAGNAVAAYGVRLEFADGQIVAMIYGVMEAARVAEQKEKKNG